MTSQQPDMRASFERMNTSLNEMFVHANAQLAALDRIRSAMSEQLLAMQGAMQTAATSAATAAATATPHGAPEREFWREKDVLQHWVRVCRTTLYRWVREGRFPKPVRMGGRAVAWRDQDLRAWAASRKAGTLGAAA